MPQSPQCEIEPVTKSCLAPNGQTLDPPDWPAFREQAHRMLDDILDYTQNIRQRPVWQPIPVEVRGRFQEALPTGPSSLGEVHDEFMNSILPFAVGNVHPGFMGWVHGGGTPVGMLAEMLAAGLNANTGGRDQIPIEVEKQIALWMQAVFGFPETAAGLFVTGTSMANFIAVVLARDVALGFDVRERGVAAQGKRLTAYASAGVHSCVSKALDLCGIGSQSLRRISTDNRHRIDLAALERAINADRESGFQPFLIVGTAGTVDTGAIDDLTGLAELARREKLWFHVDGAYGALAMLAPELAPKLRGIEQADSLAFDFHKWGQVPYDAGFVLVRNGELQKKAFAASADYLRRETRGMAAGSPWPCDYGPDLSRGFRALKTWFTLKVHGTHAMGAAIVRTCELAHYLKRRITATPELELLAPVELNIVCFRYRAAEADRINASIVVELQEKGSVAPSTTVLDGKLAIRAAIVNHRTEQRDIDTLLNQTLALGRKLTNGDSLRPAIQKAPISQSKLREQRSALLKAVERQLASNPDSIDLHLQRACLCSELGQLTDARNAYIQVLQRDPSHLVALNNLGCVLIATGHRTAAGIAFKEAVVRHPNDVMSRVNLGYFLLEKIEQMTVHGQLDQAMELKREARDHFEQILQVAPDNEKAHEGLSHIFEDLGETEKAESHRRAAFQNRCIFPLPYRGEGKPISVLHLASTTGGNVRLQRFLDDRTFQTFVLCPEFYDPATPLPAHELVVNGIGDAELSSRALVAAQSVLALTKAPVLNHPSAVLATDRTTNARRLSEIPGVVTPITMLMSRQQLCGSDIATSLVNACLKFPLLLRAPGFHTGLHFVRVENFEALPTAVAEIPGDEIIVMQYLDARGRDGKTRKYRVMMIDGQLYPLHCAISSHWKIHYFTAEMAENPQNRAEDAAFLENMPQVLGPLAMSALEKIQSTLSLDYGGIDFGLNARGEVLVFEANATMVVNPPEPDERWKYRWPAYERIQAAVRNMLLTRASHRAEL
jgi:aromatic-L-amino-acid/L-tryptophan decarboxylase